MTTLGRHAVEIGDASEEAVGAVAGGIVAAVAADAAPAADVAARRDVVGRGEGRAGEAVEDGEEFGALVDAAVGADLIGLGIADDLARAVDGAVGGLAGRPRPGRRRRGRRP